MKKQVFILLTVLLVSSVSLVLSEVILRVSGRVAVIGLHTAPEQVFAHIPGIFQPDQDFIYLEKPQLPFHIYINSLGYRGPEIALKKPPGTIRILCLGDSLTFGDFVDDHETFPYRLQELFNKGHARTEIVNAGVGGSTVIDQFYFLQKSVAIEPDVVILTFFLNDLQELGRPVPLYKSFEKNRALKSSFFWGTVYRLFGDTAFFQLALKVKATYTALPLRDQMTDRDERRGLGSREKETILLETYAETFQDMQRYLEERSIQFMFVTFPSHHQIGARTELSDLHDDHVQWVTGLAQKMDVPVVNLLDVFKENHLDKEDLYLLPYDGHPNRAAYSLAARAIFERLQNNSMKSSRIRK